jgi:hypothetical protein
MTKTKITMAIQGMLLVWIAHEESDIHVSEISF